MSAAFAFTGAQVFDGVDLRTGQAVLIGQSGPQIVPENALPAACKTKALDGGILMPGFTDLQVNGGGGRLFNDAPDVETLRTISAAHHRPGTRAFLPTLITDTPEVTVRAVKATMDAIDARVPGVVGLHLEGPHLDRLRKGAHEAALIRPMDEGDLAFLLQTAQRLPNLMVTLAPESVSTVQIAALTQAGVTVSLGHSDCDYDTAMRAFEAGAACTTHLFNAMSGPSSRAPGLVGATLDAGISAGLIADGIHVHSATIRMALGAHRGPGEVFLVTDAMACAGSDIDRFTLNGREILRQDGRLTLADGTLAGADLSLGQALRVMIEEVGDPVEKALARATSFPAALLNSAVSGGWPDDLDNLIYLSSTHEVSDATALLPVG